MAEKKRALLPPSYQLQGTPNDGNHIKVKEINNPVYEEEEETSQQIKKTTLPLPDYETLFPQKRHAVQGHTQWDHVIAEVNQKYMDTLPKFLGEEMSVDGPEDNNPTMSSPQQKNPAFRYYQTKSQDTKLATSQKAASQITPQTETPPHPQPTPDFSQRHQINTPLTFKKDTPTAKPRQKINGDQLIQEQDSASKVVSLASSLTSNTNTSDMDKRSQWTEDFAVFDPFPSTDFLSKDPWTQLNNNHQDPFTGGGQKEQKFEDCGMTVEDLNYVFSQNKPVDEFNQDSKQDRPSFKRVQNQSIASTTQLNKTRKFHEASTPITRSDHTSLARNTKNESLSQKPQADEKILNAVSRKPNPFGTEPVSVIPPRTFSDPPQVVMEENMEFQAENGSSGKMPLRAWVSPSEVQPVSPQNSSGSGLLIFPRR